MIAPERRQRLYPVWLPERSTGAAVPRRARWNPIAGAMVMAVLVTLPALLYVSQRTMRAETGYTILRLQREIAHLRAERARLQSLASALKSPQRIERYAATQLDMAPPSQSQLAAITIGSAIARDGSPVERRGMLRQIGEWLGRGEAQARERTR